MYEIAADGYDIATASQAREAGPPQARGVQSCPLGSDPLQSALSHPSAKPNDKLKNQLQDRPDGLIRGKQLQLPSMGPG